MNKSESIANLSAALARFQGEVLNPKNTANNPFYKSKYAPLCDVLNMVRPLLAKHGLSVVQFPSGDGSIVGITTTLLHTSGEWIEGEPLCLNAEKLTPQGVGSAISYGRRYSVSAVLGISSEDDDDGNHAENTPSKPKEARSKHVSTSTTTVNPEQESRWAIYNMLCSLCESAGAQLVKGPDGKLTDEAKDIIKTYSWEAWKISMGQ